MLPPNKVLRRGVGQKKFLIPLMKPATDLVPDSGRGRVMLIPFLAVKLVDPRRGLRTPPRPSVLGQFPVVIIVVVVMVSVNFMA